MGIQEIRRNSVKQCQSRGCQVCKTYCSLKKQRKKSIQHYIVKNYLRLKTAKCWFQERSWCIYYIEPNKGNKIFIQKILRQVQIEKGFPFTATFNSLIIVIKKGTTTTNYKHKQKHQPQGTQCTPRQICLKPLRPSLSLNQENNVSGPTANV